MRLLAIIVFASLLVFVFSFFKEESVESQLRKIRVEKQSEARKNVKLTLKDPDSAKFRNQSSSCGEVNAKNSFGAYTGFKRFISMDGNTVIEGGGVPTSEFNRLWTRICGD